ncbi:MAG: hypothetical protein AABN33_29775 [Acidobacteriota bacterium]
MNKTDTTRYLPRTVLRSLTLILMLLVTANGQQKPKAIWADVDLGKVETTKATKTVQPPAPDPERRMSIWREPAWYVSLGGSALDLAGSIATIDGKRVSEGNPLFRRSDGKVALTRALPVAALSLFAQYRSYKNPKYRKLAKAMMLVSGILHGAFGGARGFAMR